MGQGFREYQLLAHFWASDYINKGLADSECSLAHPQALRPYVPSLLGVLQQQVVLDNEENAILCVRQAFEYFKYFRPATEDQIKSFVDLVTSVRSHMQ